MDNIQHPQQPPSVGGPQGPAPAQGGGGDVDEAVIGALIDVLTQIEGPLEHSVEQLKWADKYSQAFATLFALLTGDPKDVATEQNMENFLKYWPQLEKMAKDPNIPDYIKKDIQTLLKNPGFAQLYQDLLTNAKLTQEIKDLKKKLKGLKPNSPEWFKVAGEIMQKSAQLNKFNKDIIIGKDIPMIQRGKPSDDSNFMPLDKYKDEYQEYWDAANTANSWASDIENAFKITATYYINKGNMLAQEASKLLKEIKSVESFLNQKILE